MNTPEKEQLQRHLVILEHATDEMRSSLESLKNKMVTFFSILSEHNRVNSSSHCSDSPQRPLRDVTNQPSQNADPTIH